MHADVLSISIYEDINNHIENCDSVKIRFLLKKNNILEFVAFDWMD